MRRSRDLVIVLVVVGAVALVAWFSQVLRVRRCEADLAQCRENLRTIAHAVEMYGDDCGGHYLQRFGNPLRVSQSAEALQSLVPGYLGRVPTCPASGKTYVVAAYNPDPDFFYVSCLGAAHRESGLPAHFPADGSYPFSSLVPTRHPVPFEQRPPLPVDLRVDEDEREEQGGARSTRDGGWAITCPVRLGNDLVDGDEGSVGVISTGDSLYLGKRLVAQILLNEKWQKAREALTALLGPPDYDLWQGHMYERPGGTLVLTEEWGPSGNHSRPFSLWRPRGP